MKTMKYMLIAGISVVTMISCGSEEKQVEVVHVNSPAPAAEEEKDTKVNFNISTDKNGKVSGGISGSLEKE